MPILFTLTSSAFKHETAIPIKYTGDGPDLSPPLQWMNSPEGTKQFALIMDDPDAPTPKPWVHWVLYQIPAETIQVPEGLKKDGKLENPLGALQGLNSWNSVGYRGPAPPPGKIHHYHFQLYALDIVLQLPPAQSKETLLKQMEGHILGKAVLTGTYKR